MNVLVTGAGGFIGSNMVKYLLEKTDYKIFGIDDFRGGKKNEGFIKNLQCDNFTFYESNISLCEEVFSEIKINVVFHFAATPRVG